MAWTLHVTGESLNARRAVQGGSAHAYGASPAVVNTGVAGINGSTSIDMTGSVVRPIVYRGQNNVPQTGVFSVVMRVNIANLSTSQPLFNVGFGGRLLIYGLTAYYHSVNQIRFTAYDPQQSPFSVFSSTGIFTANTWHDISIVWPNDGSSNGVKIFLDGTVVGQGTNIITMDSGATFVNGLLPTIGYNQDSFDKPNYRVDEFALNDTVIDPTSSGLNLNGASRSAYISTVAMDGPGTIVLPTESQVLDSVSFTDGVTSYTGNVTQPTVGNVSIGTQYGANGTQYTGTLVVNQPAADVTSVSSLVSSIKEKTAYLLGNEWSEINYVNDTEKNTSKGVTNRYGVRALPSVEVPGVTKAVTTDQTFEVVLTDRFINNNLSDSAEQTVSQTLQDKALSLYRYYIETRLNNLNVLNLTEYTCEEPEVNEKSKYVTVRFTFKVRLRNILGS